MSQRTKFRPTVNGLEERLALNAAGAAGVVHTHMATVEMHKPHAAHTPVVHHHNMHTTHHNVHTTHHHNVHTTHHHKVK